MKIKPPEENEFHPATANLGILQRDEMKGVNETLDAAALTYVAAFVATLGNLLYLLMILSGGRRNN